MKVSTVKVNGISVKVVKEFGRTGNKVWFYWSEMLGSRWAETGCRTKTELGYYLEAAFEQRAELEELYKACH